MNSSSDQRARAYLALAAICIIWGTTYPAIKFAVRDFPPFLLVGIRQSCAGIILLSGAWLTGRVTLLPRRYVLLQMFTGLATITGGNGFITWGMQHVSSGVAAVIGSLTPVLVVLISFLWRGSDKINALIISGVALGFGGLGIIFRDGWADFANPDYRIGILGCFASCLTWSLGTVMSKRWNDPNVSPILNAGIQVFAGGMGSFLLSLFLDKSHTIHHTFNGWMAISYLILIGSALAFSIYMFALKHLSATVSSLYTYINPVVAIALSWLLLGERFTLAEGLGAAVTICGVYLVNRGSQS